MSTLDKERDDLLIFITSTITQMTKSPLAAQRTAAEKLYLPVKPYIGAEQRTNAQADNPIESAKKIRLRMDEEYDEMTTYAFAQSVVKPTATTATFINRLNTLIDETNALYNQRIAQARAAAAKKQADSESPSEI